jgi:16S rRNA (guanine527-N7)-methyltransferase
LENKVDKDRLTRLFLQASQEVSVSLSAQQVELFWLYLQELLEWNKTFSLTGIKNHDDIIIKNFVDSLTLWQASGYRFRSGVSLHPPQDRLS